jgi:hypothetical protein
MVDKQRSIVGVAVYFCNCFVKLHIKRTKEEERDQYDIKREIYAHPSPLSR